MPLEARQGAGDRVLLEKSTPDALGGVDDERIRFPERKKPENMVEIAVREDDGRDGRMARGPGMQLLESFDLAQDVGRTVAKHPPQGPRADRNRVLRSCL